MVLDPSCLQCVRVEKCLLVRQGAGAAGEAPARPGASAPWRRAGAADVARGELPRPFSWSRQPSAAGGAGVLFFRNDFPRPNAQNTLHAYQNGLRASKHHQSHLPLHPLTISASVPLHPQVSEPSSSWWSCEARRNALKA